MCLDRCRAPDPGVHVVRAGGVGRSLCDRLDLRDGLEGETRTPWQRSRAGEPIWNEVEQVAGRLRHDAEIPVLLRTPCQADHRAD